MKWQHWCSTVLVMGVLPSGPLLGQSSPMPQPKLVAGSDSFVRIGTAMKQDTAQDGAEVIKKMHDKYQGVWYNTLTFVQKTTLVRPNGTRDTATWFESLKGPDRLRIDVRSLADGNGILYTADSSVIVRNGVAVARRPDGNPFLPLIMGAYLQAPEKTRAQLARFGFDLKRTGTASWENRPVIIVGTDSPADTTAAQFWIDTERLVLVRMRIGFAPEAPLLDIRVGGYEPIGEAWLGTHIEILSGTTVMQDELYTNWRANVPLDDELFDPARWRTARHWAQ